LTRCSDFAGKLIILLPNRHRHRNVVRRVIGLLEFFLNRGGDPE
jgi:hypothetical protein